MTQTYGTYQQVEDYLIGLIPKSEGEKFPGHLGLERMKLFLQKLGNPQLSYPTIHIAGTSGKGSTAFLTAKILETAGKKVGLHTSPHLQSVRERFKINNEMISERDYIDLINELLPAIEKMKSTKYGAPSYFEVLVASVFVYFKKENVDVAVIEAGLGGRFDGTNVLDATVAILTNVGLDHVNILGKTKLAILQDKMQIIKNGNAVAITGVTQPILLRKLKKHCDEVGVPLVKLHKNFGVESLRSENNYSKFDYVSQDFGKIENIKLSAPGIFQTKNAVVAITASLSFARAYNFEIKKSTIKKALISSIFPGRFEVVKTADSVHQIILDGAHNSDKFNALVESLQFIYPEKKFTVVFGLKKNKSARTLLKILAPVVNSIVITQFSRNTDMGLNLFYPAERLFNEAQKYLDCPCYLEPEPVDALKKATEISRKTKSQILITGSLYLVGEVRDEIANRNVQLTRP